MGYADNRLKSTMQNIWLLAVAVCLASCATPQQPREERITRDRVERFIIKGKTTKAEVIAAFGSPANTTIMSTSIPTTTPNAIPYETISYAKVYSSFPMDVVSLIVQLDHKGTVIGYIFTGQERVPGT
jgi:hypothetical protein